MPADMNEISADMSRMKDWAARHDAACTERNKNREKFEVRTDAKISAIETDLTTLKVRLALIAGVGASLGGGVGAAIANLFM